MSKKITFVIDKKTGQLVAETVGYTGKQCEEALVPFLNKNDLVVSVDNTEDYYKTVQQNEDVTTKEI